MSTGESASETAALVSALCDEHLTDAQLDRLNVLLVSDPFAREQYLRYMAAEASYDRLLGGPIASVDTESFIGPGDDPAVYDHPIAFDPMERPERLSLHDAWVLPAITENDEPEEPEPLELPAAPAAAASRKTAMRRTSPPRRSRGQSPFVRWSAAAVMLIGIGLAAWFGAQRLYQHQQSAAILLKSVSAQWGGKKSLHLGEAMPKGELVLQSGVAELELPGGATMIVEGPAKFAVNSPTDISLIAGKVVATVPHDVHGFAITTSTGSVIDLGTQFGVEVVGGQTHTEVFQGQIQLQPRNAAEAGITLSAGQAGDLAPTSATVDPAGAAAQHFVRDLSGGDRSLDVADLVAGGDGTTHRRNGMIDPLTGATGPMPLTRQIDTDYLYHRVSSLPVIDGCFIPNGEKGDVQVDSAGHRFPVPATDGRTYDMIFSGNHVPRPGNHKLPIPTALDHVDYSQPDHWLVYLHANVGLTFDLAALRRLHPDSALTQFHAVVGNVLGKNNKDARTWELFVLADGALRLHRKFHGADVLPIAVPLSNSDRALTLVITDGGATNGGDDILFGDPAFEMHGSR
jgi:hypothetical protein